MITRISSRTTPRDPNAAPALEFIKSHPNITIAYIDPTADKPTIVAHALAPNDRPPQAQLSNGDTYQIRYADDTFPEIRIAYEPLPHATNPAQTCQNAPIKLGCQVQPRAKPWVGTAGGPIRFTDPQAKTRWGFITNAHVTGTPATPQAAQMHQPTDRHPPIGQTIIYAYPAPNQTNTLDVALVDTYIDRAHKTDWRILPDTTPADSWSNAAAGTPARKMGRTTELTHATCSATGAAARINYAGRTMLFADLDVYTAATPFSMPGDSGSLILHAETNQPLSLLFAGSQRTTLAIPIRNIAAAIKISFQP